jgi:predicted MFS family arabinose efflux permease
MKLNDELTATADTLLARATRKAMTRLIPVMCLVYFMSYIDRTNAALAKTQLEADLGISVAAFGLGAGLFFLSYAFLEIPSNLTMFKVGPRVWIVRIAITWGILSGMMMFAQGERSFYVLRFLLGAAEAGLFPSLMYMVTIWFAQKYRATAIGFLYLAVTIALTVGGPFGGALMELDGVAGLQGWQWMFMLEGILTVLIGIATWFLLPETPKDARWLTSPEAEILTSQAIGATPHTESKLRGNMGIAFGRPFIIILGLIYMFNQVTNVGIVFNVPAIVESLNVRGSFLIGLVSGTVGIGATIGVLVVPRVYRRYHNEAAAVGILAGLSGLISIVYTMTSNPTVKIVLIGVAMIFIFGTLPVFWSIAMARMSGLMAAAGLAFINTVGLIGGFGGPYLFGLAESKTGNPSAGFTVVIWSSVVGVLLALLLHVALRREDAAAAVLRRDNAAAALRLPAALKA